MEERYTPTNTSVALGAWNQITMGLTPILNGSGVRQLDGAVDEMYIFNRVLSGSGIAILAPEPSSATLLGAGLLGLVAYAWRRRK